jgi:poly(hydroxyalkanoate) depolymerase family esterase
VARARRTRGSRHREYLLHLPPGHDRLHPLPLVMVLHGCAQDHRDIQWISGFDAIADREGFAVVYPHVTSYSGIRFRNCWGWWQPGEIRPGEGEVQDLWHIIEDVRAGHAIDPRRIHVCGLSSGAGMAVAAMVAHCDRIASGAAVAGVPYSEQARAVRFPGSRSPRYKPVERVAQAMNAAMGQRKRAVPLFVVHSQDDEVVGIQAAMNLRDSWAQCFGVDTTAPVSRRAGRSGGIAWRHEAYRRERHRRPTIETLFVAGGGHGWFGGERGEFSYPDGPDVSRLLWAFFRRHPLAPETLERSESRAGVFSRRAG